jgi:hypothetical protein
MNATMNTGGKHDFHPDAESLSAFAEQALSGRERSQVLAHLAVCGRCRQVVALAQEAGLDADVRPAAAERPAIQPYAWWRSWRFAWIPAAALAASVALAVFVHTRHVDQSAEMAKNERQQVTQPAATPASPAQQERAQAASPVAAPAPAKSQARSFKRTSEGTAPNRPPQESVVTAAMPAEPGSNEHPEGTREEAPPPSQTEAPGFAGEGSAGERTTATNTPEPAVDAWQERQEKAAAGSEQRRLYAARAAAPTSARGTDGGAAAGSSTRQATVSSPQPEMQAQPAARFAMQKQPLAAGICAGAMKAIHLPSGLAAVSMAEARHRSLAIDEAGTLFLSVDAGNHWETVTQQWTGRAVVVRTETKNSASAAPADQAPANSSSDAGAAPLPASFFEILNDKNQAWLSTDGEIWIAK